MAFCTKCGSAGPESQRFCSQCGAEVLSPRNADTVTLSRPSGQTVGAWTPATRSAEPPNEQRGIFQDPRQQLTFSQPERLFAANPHALTFGATAELGNRRNVMLIVAVLLLLVVSGGAGYWWVGGARHSTPDERVEAAGQTLTAPPGNVESRQAQQPDTSVPSAAAANSPDPEATSGSADWSIVSAESREVKNPSNALGAPDGRVTVVFPGGTLAMAYAATKYFYNAHGADLQIHGPEGDRTPYTVFARDHADDKWVRFDSNRKGFAGGVAAHDMGHHGIERAREIMIRNDGTINLYIDALTPLHREPESHNEAQPGRHRPPP